MKKFKKTLGLMLVCSLILALVPATTASAAITAYTTDYQPFNDAAPFADVKYNTFTDLYYDKDLGIITQSEGGLFGKASGDYAMKVSPTASGSKYVNLFYSVGANAIDATTTYQLQFQLAIDANGGFEWNSSTALQMKNNTAKSSNSLFSVIKENGANKVKFMSMDTDFVWADNTWYDVNFIVEQGTNATLTILINGQPLKASDGTFDGVRADSYQLPLANTDRIIKWKSMRIQVPGTAQYFYLDNWNVSVWPQGTWPAGVVKGEEYSITTTDLTTAADALAGITKLSGQGQVATDAEGEYVSIINNAYARFIMGSTERTDVTYRQSFDFKIPAGNTLANYFSYEQSGGGAIGCVLGDNSGNLAYKFGNILSGAPLPARDGNWYTFGAEFNRIAGTDGTPRTVFSLDGVNLNTPLNALYGNNPEFRIYGPADGAAENIWGVKNFKRMQVKNKPLIKEIVYGSATDDYAVDPTVDTITVTLTDTIAAADNTTVLLKDIEGNTVPTEVALGADNKTLTLTLGADLLTRTAYQLVLTDALVCEDSTIGSNVWYQTLEDELAYGFMTGYKAFDWKTVEFVISEREAHTDPATEEVTYTWKTPAAHTYGYIADNWKVGANITMVNNTGADKTVTAIVAVYGPDDRLRTIGKQDLTFAQGEDTKQILSEPVGNTSGMKVKVYIWEDIESMKPVTNGFFIWQKRDDNNGCIIPNMFKQEQ